MKQLSVYFHCITLYYIESYCDTSPSFFPSSLLSWSPAFSLPCDGPILNQLWKWMIVLITDEQSGRIHGVWLSSCLSFLFASCGLPVSLLTAYISSSARRINSIHTLYAFKAHHWHHGKLFLLVTAPLGRTLMLSSGNGLAGARADPGPAAG